MNVPIFGHYSPIGSCVFANCRARARPRINRTAGDHGCPKLQSCDLLTELEADCPYPLFGTEHRRTFQILGAFGIVQSLEPESGKFKMALRTRSSAVIHRAQPFAPPSFRPNAQAECIWAAVPIYLLQLWLYGHFQPEISALSMPCSYA